MTQNICKNCNNHFKGNFCNNCGEKVYTDHDKSLKHFLHETFHFFTHLDSKFFKTVIIIFRRPGELSVAYTNGIRKKYYNPFSLFFVGIILYLLFPMFKGLNLPFGTYIINFKTTWMHFMMDIINHKAAAKHISLDTLAEIYDHKSAAFAKVLLLIFLPLSGLALNILFRKKRKYFFDYLVLATESSNVMLYIFCFVLPLAMLILTFVANLFNVTANTGDLFALPIFAVFIVYWTIVAFKKFFALSFWQAILKGILFLILQNVVIFIIYRLVLFLTVLAFI